MSRQRQSWFRPSWFRPSLPLLLGGTLLLAALQAEALRRQPPRLLQLAAAAGAGGGGLADLAVRFSRTMDRASLERHSRLQPPLPSRWLGEGEQLVWSLTGPQPLQAALTLTIAGHDQRGQALPPQRWQWDPRARVLAAVPQAGGEQLQLRHHDGRWQPLGPVWPAIAGLEPLGDGSGVALISRENDGRFRVWRLPLQQPALRALQPTAAQGRPAIGVGQIEEIGGGPVPFAHLSSNRLGDLLLQTSNSAGEAINVLLRRQGERHRLALEASSAVALVPQGGAAVVPGINGLSLEALPPRPPQRQLLPGRHNLSSFCPRAGRALLLRHWPDYRRSLDLVLPGKPPRQIWLGQEAVVATACAGGGERLWALLVDGIQRPELTLLAIEPLADRPRLRRLPLTGWELEPGTGLRYDPASDQLLLALRRFEPRAGQPPPASRPTLIDGRSLELRQLDRQAALTAWLPPG
ncbi:MAG: hypothetical protein R6W06_02155 [Prochlorococcaceae cyanobacterium]